MHRIVLAVSLVVVSFVTIPVFAAEPIVVDLLARKAAGRRRPQGGGNQPYT